MAIGSARIQAGDLVTRSDKPGLTMSVRNILDNMAECVLKTDKGMPGELLPLALLVKVAQD